MDQFVTSINGTLNKYAEFKGIASRAEYWFFFLFNLIVAVFASFLDNILPVDFLSDLFGLLLFIPGLAVGIRRMHDTDHRGWFILVPFYSIYLLVAKSRPNRWGVDSTTFGWTKDT